MPWWQITKISIRDRSDTCQIKVQSLKIRQTLLCSYSDMIGHYIDVIITTMASQITSLMVVYSTVYSDADQSKHQSSASLAFVWGIHRDRWIPRTKGQLRGKYFHLMTSSWFELLLNVAWHRDDHFVGYYDKIGHSHYSGVIMNAIASQITGVSMVCLTV